MVRAFVFGEAINVRKMDSRRRVRPFAGMTRGKEDGMNKIVEALKAVEKDPAAIKNLYWVLARSTVVFGAFTDPETKNRHIMMARSQTGEKSYIPFFASLHTASYSIKSFRFDQGKFVPETASALKFFQDTLDLGLPYIINPHGKFSREFSLDEAQKIINLATRRERGPEPLTDRESRALDKIIEDYQKANSVPRTMDELIDMASSCLDSRLVFHPKVKESVKSYPEYDSPEVRAAAWRMFVGLSSSLYPMIRGKDISEDRFFKENGIALVMVGTPPEGDEIFIKARTAQYGGREITFYSYIFNPKHFDFPLHFHILDDGRILVCHLGKELPFTPKRKNLN